MKVFIFVMLANMATIYGCQKECSEYSIASESCDPNHLVICDSSSFDLKNYVFRKDDSYLTGTATAVKFAFGKGEKQWVANNGIIGFNEENYFLSLANYADTSWVGLEYWAYLREVLLIKLNPYQIGIQQIVNEEDYESDSTVFYGRYYKWVNDILDAKWEINTDKTSFILISSIDTIHDVVAGEFDLYFKLTEQSILPGVNYASEVRFRCGKFRSRIIE